MLSVNPDYVPQRDSQEAGVAVEFPPFRRWHPKLPCPRSQQPLLPLERLHLFSTFRSFHVPAEGTRAVFFRLKITDER